MHLSFLAVELYWGDRTARLNAVQGCSHRQQRMSGKPCPTRLMKSEARWKTRRRIEQKRCDLQDESSIARILTVCDHCSAICRQLGRAEAIGLLVCKVFAIVLAKPLLWLKSSNRIIESRTGRCDTLRLEILILMWRWTSFLHASHLVIARLLAKKWT